MNFNEHMTKSTLNAFVNGIKDGTINVVYVNLDNEINEKRLEIVYTENKKIKEELDNE